MLEAAGEGRLNAQAMFRALRLRHNYQPYLGDLLGRLQSEERHLLTAILCRATLERWNSPRFKHHLELAEQKLARMGRTLPARREAGGGLEAPFPFDEAHDFVHAAVVAERRHDERTPAPRGARIAFELVRIDADMGGEIHLVHHQKVRPGEAGALFRGISCPAAVSIT